MVGRAVAETGGIVQTLDVLPVGRWQTVPRARIATFACFRARRFVRLSQEPAGPRLWAFRFGRSARGWLVGSVRFVSRPLSGLAHFRTEPGGPTVAAIPVDTGYYGRFGQGAHNNYTAFVE